MAPRYRTDADSFKQKLALYSAGAASLLAAAPAQGQSCNAPATLVGGQYCYTDVDPDQTRGGTFDIDIEHDGTNEMRIRTLRDYFFSSIFASSLADIWRGARTGGNYYFDTYQSGQSISVVRPYSRGFLCYNTLGPWDSVTDRFLGFSFQLSGQTHYGWVRLDVGNNCSSFTVKDYAYNTVANDPIPAGFANLPVELASFTATADGRTVVLAWQTLSETNNAGFELQRLERGAWQPLGFVQGHGTTAEARSYRHRLQDQPPGTQRYRLKQVDFDGAFDYSPEVEVYVQLTETFVLSAPSPNPSRSGASLELQVGHRQAVRAALYDVLGREVTELYAGEAAPGVAVRFSVPDGLALPAGLYVVRVEGERFAATETLTVTQ